MTSTKEWYNKHPGKKAEDDRKYRLKHLEQLKEKSKLRYLNTDPEERKRKQRQYYLSHKKQIRERNDIWEEKNKDKVIKYRKEYSLLHKDSIKKYRKEYYEENKERILSFSNDYYHKNENNKEIIKQRALDRWRNMTPEEKIEHNRKRRERYAKDPSIRNIPAILRQATDRAGGGKISKEEWENLCAQFNNQCIYCGSSENITIEHKIPVSRGGTNELSNLAPACAGCNYSKNRKTPEEFKEWLKTHTKRETCRT